MIETFSVLFLFVITFSNFPCYPYTIFEKNQILIFSLGVWGWSHQVILSLDVKTGRFSSAGDMIFGILWTQYLSSQRPNKDFKKFPV